jgi:hypothetical protein
MTVDEGRIFNLLRNVAEQYDEDTHILAGWLASRDHKIDELEKRITNLDANDLTRKQEVHEAFALIDELASQLNNIPVQQSASPQKAKLVPCPVCKGFGIINTHLFTVTGPQCAYCTGTGKVNPDEVQTEIVNPQYERRIKETVEMGTALSDHLLQIESRLDTQGDWLSEVTEKVAICEVLLNSQADWSQVVDLRLTALEAQRTSIPTHGEPPEPDNLRELAETARAYIDASHVISAPDEYWELRAKLSSLVSTVLDNLPTATLCVCCGKPQGECGCEIGQDDIYASCRTHGYITSGSTYMRMSEYDALRHQQPYAPQFDDTRGIVTLPSGRSIDTNNLLSVHHSPDNTSCTVYFKDQTPLMKLTGDDYLAYMSIRDTKSQGGSRS